MTIRQKWSEFAQQLSTGIPPGTTALPKEHRFFAKAFAVAEGDLPLLALLEARGHLRYTNSLHLPTPIDPEAWIRSIDKLLWLGWVVPGAAGWGEFTYSATGQYRRRLQLWEAKEWQETETGYQPGYPSEEDMVFPMKKEVYEEKLEKISDDLQGLQLNYVGGNLLAGEEDEDDEVYRKMAEQEKAVIFELLQEYETWKAYTPKYYPEP